MRLVGPVIMALTFAVVLQSAVVEAQTDVNLAELVLAVRRGLVVAQEREVAQGLAPLFLVKDFEMTLTVTVEKGAQGGVEIKVVSLGGNVKREDVHTISIRSEVVIFEEFKSRLVKCLSQSPKQTYVECFKRVEADLGIPRGSSIRGNF